MQITYRVTPDDFVGFNLSYMSQARQMRASIRSMQLISAALIVGIGIVLMLLNGNFSPLWIVTYLAIAVAAFFVIPPVVRRRVKKSVYRTLSLPQNKHVCTEKTLMLETECLHLTGGGEDSKHPYATVERIDEDTARYYIYVGPMSAVIVPFSAFDAGEQKAAFYTQLCERVEAAGGKVKP